MRHACPKALSAAGILAVAFLAGWSARCGGGGAPTTPATPVPTPIPAPTPDPNVPPADSGCGQPYPPKLSRLSAKVHLKDKDYWTLDATPQIGPNGDYCAAIGFTDGRLFCPVRPEGAPDRAACENWRIGIAKDTGKPGPTWTFTPPDGTQTYCTGPDSGCEHNDNPFQMNAYKGGIYQVCAADPPGLCDQVNVERGL
jgi:hypothetical protein